MGHFKLKQPHKRCLWQGRTHDHQSTQNTSLGQHGPGSVPAAGDRSSVFEGERGEALERFRKNNTEKVQKAACEADVVMLQQKCKRLVRDGKPKSASSFTSFFTHFPSVHTHGCPFLGMFLISTHSLTRLSHRPGPTAKSKCSAFSHTHQQQIPLEFLTHPHPHSTKGPFRNTTHLTSCKITFLLTH